MASLRNERFFQSTGGRIVVLLRSGPRTVNELAAALGLTDNAVRAQLANLERDGLVRAAGQQRGRRKPNVLYALGEAAEQLFPRPYDVVLNTLLHVLQAELPAGGKRRLLRTAGHRLARTLRARITGTTVGQRAAATVAVLNELGGLAELAVEAGQPVIRGRQCPFGALVPEHEELCAMAETLVGDLIGVRVHEECDKGAHPQCRFRLVTTAPRVAG